MMFFSMSHPKKGSKRNTILPFSEENVPALLPIHELKL
jgi:hypothetical protein